MPQEPPKEQIFQPINLTCEAKVYTEDLSQCNIIYGEEKGDANGVPQPVGFWHPLKGDVQSHVLKAVVQNWYVSFSPFTFAGSKGYKEIDTFANICYKS